MNNNAPDVLLKRLQAIFPAAELELERFPSGAWLLDMRLEERFFVASFSPSDGYGFDEVKDGDGLTSNFTHAASGLDELVEGLSKLVRD
jgi:hypothetical protein